MSDDLDPSEFVQRIRQLGEQRDQQDAERVKKLEEELIQGRSERLARRAERARSISPDKPYTPQSPRSSRAPTPRDVQEKAASTPTPSMAPPREPTAAAADDLTSSPPPQLAPHKDETITTIEDMEPKKPVASSAAALGRSGTLSWKQRPQSGSIRRPLSMSPTRPDRSSGSASGFASASAAEPASPERPISRGSVAASPERPMSRSSVAASPERPISRGSIAASLSAKDASYFRQTADRGAGSAAYRKSQEESASDAGSMTGTGRRALPGMSRDRDSTREPDVSSPPPESARSSSPGSRGGSARESTVLSNRFSTNTSISAGDVEPVTKRGSALPLLDSQKFAPPSEAGSMPDEADNSRATRGMAMSPTQGRISPERERSTSPTKGMGGFVQSAMLKRSDSVSKRWSTATPPGLTRQNSTMSNRGSAMAGYGSLSKADKPTLSRDNSIEPSSRPTSSHSNATVTRPGTRDEDRAPREFVKPALPAHSHSRSKSVASTFSEKDQPQDDTSPPSPSKRWSPTKSSWLESALSKPDSPKLKQPPPPAQPAWMAEISRIKQQRGSIDMGRSSPLQGSPGDALSNSRPSSPIKDIQLKPVGLRRPDSPKKEEPAAEGDRTVLRERAKTLADPSATLRPMLPPPKPSDKELASSSEEMASPREQFKAQADMPETQTVSSPKTDSSPSLHSSKPSLTSRVSSPSLSERPVASRFAQDTGLAMPKARPVTPPKNFRAGLKSRQPAGGAPKTTDDTNELANVFGKLRKAETKNYVAPDPLKDNIMRGKNALNVTGGPKPSERRDEFRESLRHKKSVILEKAKEEGTVLKRSSSSSDIMPTPEAIAKRGVLNRAESGPKASVPPKEEPTPEALARKKSLRTLSKPAVEDKSAQPAPLFASKAPAVSGKLAGRFDPGLAGMLARGPPPMATKGSTSSADADTTPTRPAQEEKSGPPPELQHMTKGRARGPKRRAPKQTAAAPERTEERTSAASTAVPSVKPEHVLPSSELSKTNGQSEESTVTRTPARQSSTEKPATPAKSPRIASGNFGKAATPELPKKPTSSELDRRVSGSHASVKKSSRPDSIGSPKLGSPGIPKKPASLEVDRRSSGSFGTPQKSAAPKTIEMTKAPSPSPSSAVNHSRFSRPLPTLPTKSAAESPKSTPLKEISTPNIDISPARNVPSPEKSTFTSVKNATSLWGRQSASSSPVPTLTKSPIKLPTRADEQAAIEDAGLVRSPDNEQKPLPKFPPVEPQSPATPMSQSPATSKPLPSKPKPTGLGFSLGSLGSFVASRSRESSPQPPVDYPASPPTSAHRPQSEPFTASPQAAKPQKNDGMFAEFFDESPVTNGQLPDNIDTVQVLKSPPFSLGPASKIRTLRKQIQEVNGDGKLASIPQQEEHVLFQESMYLCTHVYEDAKGAKHTDVYLWAGNGVPEPNIEDAQLFAKNHARQNQGNLVILRQGQEPPNFFDALGGIVITRRGTNPSSKQFVLCGRRHLGHLAFDEVDFSLKSLCSAYPYLVSTASGKVFLWKGRGCSAEELSGARLMGMDLAPTGDFTEIDEGSEPSSFLSIFSPSPTPTKGPAIPRSADHWRYKATNDKYRVRLYRIEQSSAQTGGWGSALQVSSSFFAPLLRRPSWNGAAIAASTTTTNSNHAEQRPQTPLTPKSPAVSIKTAVKEIMPFSQRDLEPEGVFVLDAFFEMYIIVGALSRSQAPAFSTALLFAQEYAMIAVSEEDRPFLPVTTVVLEGVPRDMKAVFRHWDDERIPAAGLMRGKLGRGKSLRIVGLERAIEGTRG
ncbi:hypothetical protein IAQ61_005328 [Plenodomus lingam]|uniref:uncharacterized protein n=1 Tax=Leptosphaeria maculans TaxID=5022 RepID=UPI003334644A|nr:hypothetical protein IAQ61_005328 [Plenodomus lingam]